MKRSSLSPSNSARYSIAPSPSTIGDARRGHSRDREEHPQADPEYILCRSGASASSAWPFVPDIVRVLYKNSIKHNYDLVNEIDGIFDRKEMQVNEEKGLGNVLYPMKIELAKHLKTHHNRLTVEKNMQASGVACRRPCPAPSPTRLTCRPTSSARQRRRGACRRQRLQWPVLHRRRRRRRRRRRTAASAWTRWPTIRRRRWRRRCRRRRR